VSGFQILIILVCAALGFGIVNNMIGSARKPRRPEQDEPQEPDER
jgi:hypothetical protein